MKIFVVLSILVSLNSWASPAVPKPTITWILTSTTSQSSKVVTEKHPLYKLYIQNLTNYNHALLYGNVTRIEVELKSKKLVCYPGSSEYSRRKEFSYLTPQYIQPSPQLVTRKKIADQLLAKYKNGIALKDILNDKSLHGLAAENRSFGDTLDKIISSNGAQLKRAVLNPLGDSVAQFIEKGRVDYSLEYPFIIQDLRNQNKVSDNIVSISLTDADVYITQYLACSKTPEGLAVIKLVDKIIRDNIRNEAFTFGTEALTETQKTLFQKEFNKYTEKRVKAPIVIE